MEMFMKVNLLTIELVEKVKWFLILEMLIKGNLWPT
jgi:hypothetical protein